MDEDGVVLATDTSSTLITAYIPEEPEEATPIEMFFAPIIGFFYEHYIGFGFGLNIFLALLAMPFYVLFGSI